MVPVARVAISLLGLVAPSALGSQSTPAARYVVTFVGDRCFDVTVAIDHTSTDFRLFHFPTKERPQGQAESVSRVEAQNAAGVIVPISYAGDGAWKAREPVARLAYRVCADHDAVRWPYGKDEVATRFDSTYFFVGHAFFLSDFDWPVRPVTVEFRLPARWRVTAPWRRDTTGAFVASMPAALIQNAFAVGTDVAMVTRAGAMSVTSLVDSRLAALRPTIQRELASLATAYNAFWGRAPVDRFVVFAFADPETDGGAFTNSFALRIATPTRDVDATVWSHMIAHEFMHLWNGVARIRSAADGSTYWFTEGVTDYLAIRLAYESGVIDRTTLEQRLANVVRRYMIARRFTPGVTLSAAGAKKSDYWELLYGGGALYALVLDGELRRRGPHGFRDALRDVYANADEPYNQRRLLEVLDRTTDARASDVLRWIDAGPTPTEVRDRLAAIGIEVSTFANDEVYLRVASGPNAAGSAARAGTKRP